MNIIRLLILGLLAAITLACRAQNSEPGWFRVGKPELSELARFAQPLSSISAQSQQAQANGLIPQLMQSAEPSTPIAEAITPHIQALADGLQDDPYQIFNYVHDHIKFVLYFGSKKGAELTLLEKSGNDFDQSALLVALLRAAGYTNVKYQFGWQQIPYDSSNNNNYDLRHWWQLTLNNTNWTTTWNYLRDLTHDRGYPSFYYVEDGNDIVIQRTWVALTFGGTTYQLDPAFKISKQVTTLGGFSLTNAMGGAGTTISNAILTAAGGTDNVNYSQSLNEAAVRDKLTSYTTNILNYIQSNAPNASVQEILSGWKFDPSNDNWDFSIYTTFTTNDFSGKMPIQSWDNIPTNMMSTLKITFAGTNYQWFIPQLQGQRLALTFDGSGTAQLWQDDSNLAQHATSSGSTTNVVVAITHPLGTWDSNNNLFIYNPTNVANTTVTNAYQRTNATYAILYAFEPDWGWLQQRQGKLDTYLQQGLTNGSRQITSETLNIIGLNWMLQTAQMEQMQAAQLGMLPMYYHRVGRMAQETGKGYYVDAYMQLTGQFPNSGDDAASLVKDGVYFDLCTYFASAMEHEIIEQLQNSNLVGASTVKMLEIANTNGQAIYLASSTNWTAGYNVKSHLANYDTNTLEFISTNYIDLGFSVMLPQNGSNHVSATTGSWAGYGYEARRSANGVMETHMIIAGNYHGGYVSDSTAVVDGSYVDYFAQNQSDYFSTVPISTPAPTGADPVDLANGTFQLENTDLSLGQAEPRGITLSRYYNGTRRLSNPVGMAGGWLHSYNINTATVAAPQSGLGDSTPAQAASMLAATAASIATYNGGLSNPKNWTVISLIAKWGIDQLVKNGVSVNLGKETLQFVKQPNGVFTPPGNSTATLTQSNSSYSLQMRHGNRFNFNAAGLLTNIVDQYSQSLNLTYNASNWVSTVKDWKNRQFTFNYTGSPQRLTSVTDGIRTVNYGYTTTYNSQGDLTTFTDAENKPSTYVYDTNHQITATLDAQSRLVVSNVYNIQGHITTQYTQGDINKRWQIYWSGWRTTVFDPNGGQTDYYFDDQGRLGIMDDPLSYAYYTDYDGQNHITATLSPLDEINEFIYDGNNNLTNVIDALGFTNQFIYDAQNLLIRSIDANGNPTTFGYNAQYSLTGRTNGAGDWVNYNFSTDGTLHTTANSGGTTTYGYDSFGQLNNIAYPGGLGSETFMNSALGDVTNHNDARNYSTSFSYNSRRQLTNTIDPTNMTMKVSYDAVGNIASTIDFRQNTTSNAWSATRHLLSTTLPPTPAGVAVITNIYDSRECLIRSIDPLQQPTLFTNDANGRLFSMTDPVQRTSTFGYDADGRKLVSTNAANETSSQTWDARGSLLNMKDGAGHLSQRGYNAVGNQITLTNRNGKKWQFQYDAANRLTNTITPLNRTASLTYNHQGSIATTKDPGNQTTSFLYDGKNRLTSRTDSIGTTSYGYDGNNNRTSVAENGNTLTWTYDAYNRVSSYKDVYGNLIQYRYDANGNVTNLVYPGGHTVTYSYDSMNQLTDITDWTNRKTFIQHDLAGHLTYIHRPNGSYRIVGYDAAGQSTNILELTSLLRPIALFQLNWKNSGTIASEFGAPLPHVSTMPTRTMTYDDDNRLATYNGISVGKDSNGNLTSGPLTNGTFNTYVYDPRNRLLNVAGVTGAYDAMNNRIGQYYGTNSTVFVVNPVASLPQVLMRIKNGITNYYVYGAGFLYQVTETATATNTLTYHYDYRGSTVAITDDNGNVTDRVEYSAYGSTTYRTGSTDTPFLLNGRYGVMTDPNGLLYMCARYYNPYLCRFINPDPLGFGGGLNFYAYANGNPVSYLDPFGLSGWSVAGHYLEGAAIGVGTAAIVVIAAPEIAAGGAAALVWAGVEAATATTISSATVTVGLAATATYGTSQVAGDAVGSWQGHNWNQVAFDAGTLTGGFLVGAGGGGRAMAEAITGKPSSIAPSWNPFADTGLGYDSSYPNGSLLSWLATAPTPQSGAGVVGLTAGSAASSTLGNWLTPSTPSITPYSPSSSSLSLSSQSSSTGK